MSPRAQAGFARIWLIGVALAGALLLLALDQYVQRQTTLEAVPRAESTGVVIINADLGQGIRVAGTGMVVSASGEVLTNNHVVRGVSNIRVTVPQLEQTFPAHVLGYDPAHDTALLKLDGASRLETVPLAGQGLGAGLTVGAPVQAVGNIEGGGTLRRSHGQVTALGQSLVASDEQGNSEQLAGLIEHSAPIQPGDSGGPLYDGDGHVVGMDTAGSSLQGFYLQVIGHHAAYAIPIEVALQDVQEIDSGQVSGDVHLGPSP